MGHKGGLFNTVLSLLHSLKLRIALLQSEELSGTYYCLGLQERSKGRAVLG